MIVCICKAVSDSEIKDAVACGACNVEDIQDATSACTQCGKCYNEVDRIITAELVSIGKTRAFQVQVQGSSP